MFGIPFWFVPNKHCPVHFNPDKSDKESYFVFPWNTCNPCQVDPKNDLFQLCSYMIRCANKFFRMLRREGVLLEGDACTVARTAGHEMNVP